MTRPAQIAIGAALAWDDDRCEPMVISSGEDKTLINLAVYKSGICRRLMLADRKLTHLHLKLLGEFGLGPG